MKMFNFATKANAPQPAPQSSEAAATAPSQSCALWHDIARALDQAPRNGAAKGKGAVAK